MKKFFKSAILFSAVLGILFFNAGLVFAANDCGVASGTEGRSCTKKLDGMDCLTNHCSGDENIQCCKIRILDENIDESLTGFMQLALAVAKWILGLSGSATLLMFVYGGVMMLISGGSSDKVKQGKDIIVGAVIGLLIVFSSYTIIGFVMSTMGLSSSAWASSTWFK